MHPVEEVIGAVGLTEMIVRPGDTSVAIGIGDLPIIAPSLLINLMEHAAILSLDLFHYLPRYSPHQKPDEQSLWIQAVRQPLKISIHSHLCFEG